MEHIAVNRSVHTACKQQHRIAMQICTQMCFCVLCELGLNWRNVNSMFDFGGSCSIKHRDICDAHDAKSVSETGNQLILTSTKKTDALSCLLFHLLPDGHETSFRNLFSFGLAGLSANKGACQCPRSATILLKLGEAGVFDANDHYGSVTHEGPFISQQK